MQQLVLADAVVVNKCDGLPQAAREEAAALVTRCNPTASVVFAEFGAVDSSIVQPEGRRKDLPESFPQHSVWRGGTVCVTVLGPYPLRKFDWKMDLEKLKIGLREFAANPPQENATLGPPVVYRMKGAFAHGGQGQALLQAVASDVSLVPDGPEWATADERLNKLVAIGRNVDFEPLKQVLQQCLAIPEPKAMFVSSYLGR
mmetsp:Transcript_30669/g.69164  ORF Transcript_30669/g.69164 Transcript_30669/m.69164 type:complete len:201 (-) Transcript_30669:132-734(-)